MEAARRQGDADREHAAERLADQRTRADEAAAAAERLRTELAELRRELAGAQTGERPSRTRAGAKEK